MKCPKSLQWRIASTYTLLIFLLLGIVSVYLVNYVRNSYVSGVKERVREETWLTSESLTRYLTPTIDIDGLRVEANRIAKIIGARVTVIAPDGVVLADTWEDPASMENHAYRPEVMAALSGGWGESTRHSATVGQDMLYMAITIESGGSVAGIVRVALPTSEIQAGIGRIVATIALSALVVAALAIVLAYYLAQRTARSVRAVTQGALRVASGDLDYKVEALAGDETEDMAKAFNSMAASLRGMVDGLSAERNMLSAVLETMADGVVVVGRDGRVTLVNHAAETLLGIKEGSSQGRRFIEVVRDHELQGLVSSALSSSQREHGEIRLLTTHRYLSATATPLSGGNASGVLLTLHDQTRAQQIETTRREFVSNVSHELRSPLASIRAMVETLEEGALEEGEVARDFVQRIHREVDRMSALTDDILQLFRLESGQAQMEKAPVDVRALVQEVLARFDQRASAKGVALNMDFPETLPDVKGDEQRIMQVLVNLLDNALKFTEKGGRVTVSAGENGEHVVVSVSDTGIGIPREHIPHIFERFYKVERSRRDSGTGLGLAIVKHIVQAHGGEVGVESQEGVGSVFTFTLPIYA